MLCDGGAEERAVCGSRGERSVSDFDLLKESRTLRRTLRLVKIRKDTLGYCT